MFWSIEWLKSTQWADHSKKLQEIAINRTFNMEEHLNEVLLNIAVQREYKLESKIGTKQLIISIVIQKIQCHFLNTHENWNIN